MIRRWSPFVLMLVSSLAGAQLCRTAIVSTVPDSRYQVRPGGEEVLDLETNLIWRRCSQGQTWTGVTCRGEVSRFSWRGALRAAQGMGGGWRVPNVKELLSLMDDACVTPAVNETVFPATPIAWFWTSTQFAYYRGSAWLVYSNAGHADNGNKADAYPVRLVRSSD